MHTVWTVKGGKQGEREDRCLASGVIGGGWERLPSLGGITSREELAAQYEASYPEASPKARMNYVAQLWSLVHRMQNGDLVVLPLKTTGTIAVGRVAGPYEYRTDLGDDLQHTRRVEWVRTDVARDAFDQDLLFSFGAFLTIGQVRRERAEERILGVLNGTRTSLPTTVVRGADLSDGEADVSTAPDVEAIGREEVRRFISENFAGHDLTGLVAGILDAQGFALVEVSPPGPDRGIDILAGSGALGLDSPRVVVQVKTDQAGFEEYRSLLGIVGNLRADYGLLVAWRGFRGNVKQEAKQNFFAVRLWDADVLMDEMFAVYDGMSEELRSALPLKRVWTLVPTE